MQSITAAITQLARVKGTPRFEPPSKKILALKSRLSSGSAFTGPGRKVIGSFLFGSLTFGIKKIAHFPATDIDLMLGTRSCH